MTDDESGPDHERLAAERRRRRPAPTIELTATEVASEPGRASSEASPSQANMSSAREPPDDKAEQAAGATTPRRPIVIELPFGLTWHMLGAAGAGAAIALVLLGVLSLAGVFGRSGEDATTTRLGAIEAQLRGLAERRPVTTIDPRTIDDFAARLAKAEQAIASPRAATD